MKNIYLGVREFALPVPRTGSIEANSGYGALPSSGQEIHTRIQNENLLAFSNYRKEFRLGQSFEVGNYKFVVSGRVDGIYEGVEPHLEEIKTTFNEKDLHLKLKNDPDHPYCLQLKTYAYFYNLEYGVQPKITLHLVSSRNGKDERLELDFARGAYEEWLHRRLKELVSEAKVRETDTERRKKLAATIKFPFSAPREGQIDLIDDIQKGLDEYQQFLIQAPTGLGKTIGILYPTLQESLARGQKTVYVTPKNSQHGVVEDAAKRFQENGQSVKTLTLQAKSKMCFKAETICNPEYCEYAKDYYAKVADAGLVQKMSKNKNMTPRKFKAMGEKFKVCPFELSLDCVSRADLVVGDYNYAFAPRNILGRLSPTPLVKTSRPNLIIDEAHNLHVRATDYYSPEISTRVLKSMGEKIAALPSPFSDGGMELLQDAVAVIENYRTPAASSPDGKVKIDTEVFLRLEFKIRDFLGQYLESDVQIGAKDVVLGLFNYWSNFTASLEYLNETFFSTLQTQGYDLVLKVTCCDASEMIKPTYENFQKIIGFSATLKPFEYYGLLAGFNLPELKTKEYLSPFPKKNRKLVIIPQVSTKFADRGSNYLKISQAIEKIIGLKKGNYFVFFPSFDFLEEVAHLVNPGIFTVIRQSREMKLRAITEVLDALRSGQSPHLVFAVQGGVFSEGVDYPGDMIIGALIIGPALPTHTTERKLIKEYYDKTYQRGFEYAYSYPAMAKVVQSAGRVIRSDSDRGLIVLMDHRFVQKSYTQSMPTDWFENSVQELVSKEILTEISEFWNEGAENDGR